MLSIQINTLQYNEIQLYCPWGKIHFAAYTAGDDNDDDDDDDDYDSPLTISKNTEET